ncbi:MAG: hypothetical protein K2X46_18705, partial [Roseomonas sp.]|nr:hypothetical protein [Roseomonas sp.]
RTGNWMASGAGPLRDGERCLVVLRGRIGSETAAGIPALPRQGSLPSNLGETTNLSAPPDFYMEAGLRVTAQGERLELVLEPRLLHFARTAARRGKDEAKALGLVLVLRGTPLPPNPTVATARENAEAVFALDLGLVRPGTEIVHVGGANPFANLRQVSVIRASAGSINFGAFVTEAGTPDEVLRLVNATMARQGDALTKALSEAIQAAVREAGR